MNAEPSHLTRPDDPARVFCGAVPRYFTGGITWRAHSARAISRVSCRRCLAVRAAERRETASAIARKRNRSRSR